MTCSCCFPCLHMPGLCVYVIVYYFDDACRCPDFMYKVKWSHTSNIHIVVNLLHFEEDGGMLKTCLSR